MKIEDFDEKESLKNILWGMGVGTWEWNIQTGETRFNERWAEIVGFRLEELQPTNIDTWMSLAHPDDLAESEARLDAHFKGETDFYECEARMRHKEGHWVWVLDRGRIITWTAANEPEWIVGTHLDITERKEMELAFHEKAEELRLSNKELEQFAYVASHDLRQPLRMINSYLQMLERRLGKELSAENKKMMDFAVKGAQRLDQMLLALLDYSRVGRKGQPKESFHLAEGLQEALLFLQPDIQDSQAKIRWEPENLEAWPQVQASPDEMTRLFQNLLSNALKYRYKDQSPDIRVTLTSEQEHWKIRVQDNGIGIDPEQSERLFQVFQRLHTQQEYAGTGVGLAVVRKIVERHGGQVGVEPNTSGQGSCFYFTLSC